MSEAPTWIVLVHHLPPRPTRLRVGVWRRLQKLGAVPVKSSVYVLPWSDRTLEDFTWLRQEIEAGGGEAVLFRANAVAGATDAEIIAAFRRDRDRAYARLAGDLQAMSRRLNSQRRSARPARPSEGALEMEVQRMQAEFDRNEEIDYFQAPLRASVADALEKCRNLLHSTRAPESGSPAPAASRGAARGAGRYQGRLWVTRPRPHIDRCASAWLIRRFIDRRPRFRFAVEAGRPGRAIPFDMAGAEFGHHGEDCTFETLLKHFALQRDTALRAIGQIVHDIDLKDGKFGRPEASGVNSVLRGLAERVRDDHRLLREAEPIFDGLYVMLGARPASGGRSGRPRRR